MINYLAGLLLLLCLALGLTASLYRSDAISWHGKYDGLVSSYADTAQKAKDDAAAKEAKDLQFIKDNAAQAESFATTRQVEAEVSKKAYLGKLAGLKATDCANQPIPASLLP